MTKCIDCGEDLPKLKEVCAHCQTVRELKEIKNSKITK